MPDVAIKKKRPVWFNVNLLNLPLPGIISILHRVSGALMFVALVWLLWLLDGSLRSAESFAQTRAYLAHPLVKLALFALLWAYLHHFCAGIRYLLLDMHKGIELATARATSVAVLVVSLALTLVVGGLLLW